MEIPKIQTGNLFEQVYEALKAAIVRREFQLNEKISLPELARQFGVSITPVREALNRLETEGFVRTVPKVGTFVVGIDKDFVRHIAEIRLMIDCWHLERCKRLPDDAYAQMLGAMERAIRPPGFRRNPPTADIERLGHCDLAFHTAFIQSGGNTRMLEMYRNAMSVRPLTVCRPTPEQYLRAMEQHEHILERLKRRDWDGARAAIGRHLDDSDHNMLSWIESSGGVI